MKVLSSPLKVKSKIDSFLDFSLSRSSFLYDVEKSYVVIALKRFLSMLYNDLMGRSEFFKT